MNISQKGIELIKSFEGLYTSAYLDPVGIWTIGYGHTGSDVWQGKVITNEMAENLLHSDLNRFESGVNDLVKVPLTQSQYDALVSFAFNCGLGAFGSSDLLAKLNRKDYQGASNEFGRWVHGGGVVLQGLVRRRQAEKQLFDSEGLTGGSNTNTGEWKGENGTFEVKTNDGIGLPLWDSASTKGNKIAQLPEGSLVKYNAYKIDYNGYVWIQQKRQNGYGYVPTGVSRNGKRVHYWGNFK